ALGADSKALWAAGRRVAMLHSLWILAATFFTVLTYVFVKWVPPQYEIWDIFFVRSCYMAFFAVLMAAGAKTPLKTKIPKAHIGRAICGMLALLINIVTVQHLQIGTAETLFYTMPLFVSLFVIIEKMRLGERTDWVLVGSVLCGFAGICMVLQPSCGSHELPYAVLAVLSAILAAGSAMFLKRLGAAGEPIFRTVFWFSAASLVISAVAEVFLSRASMKDLFTDPMLFAVGICTMGAQLAQTLGWGRGRPLLCACLQFSAILFAVFFGWLFFDEKLESFATVGIVIIIAAELAAAVIGLRSRARRGSSA
ncbi:DMT family transporter, partial [Sutterella wadsworthensis]|uniref:DMT family transporter n=3 Tax=Sutterellaceae TaxID=995019 RepID=UPI0026668218